MQEVSGWKGKILLVCVGQAVSLLTSSMMQMCLIWYLTARTGSAAVITGATIAGFMPQALLGPFVGAVIDRYPKKNVIILADLFISCASLGLVFFLIQGEPPIYVIYIALVLRSLGTSFHEPTTQALVPLLVPKQHLERFAGFSQGMETLSMLLAPSLSVILFQIWDLSWIIALDVVGALVAVFFLALVPVPREETLEKSKEKLRLVKETVEGIREMKEISGIVPLMFVSFCYSAIYSPIGSLYPHMTMNYFLGNASHSAFVEIVFSCGTLLGALLLGKIAGSFSPYVGIFGSIFVYGLGSFLTGLLPVNGFPVFVLLSFFIGSSTPFFHGILRSYFQLRIPPEILGRSFALCQSAKRLGMPVGLLLGGQFADYFGVNIMYAVFGGLAMILALLGVIKMKDVPYQ